MKKIFEEYGTVIVVVVVIALLIGLLSFILSPDGVISKAFDDLISGFTNNS